MLDLKFIRENPDAVREAIRVKRVALDLDDLLARDRDLVALFNRYQGKSSARSPNCTSDACASAKVCYMRSASAPLGALCPQGFGSVQSPYTGVNF